MIQILEKEVTQILNTTPKARDCDLSLYYMLAKGRGLSDEKVSSEDFLEALGLVLKMIKKGLLPSMDSVSRCRRKVQELNIDLRGKKWEDRHKNQEPKVRREMRGDWIYNQK